MENVIKAILICVRRAPNMDPTDYVHKEGVIHTSDFCQLVGFFSVCLQRVSKKIEKTHQRNKARPLVRSCEEEKKTRPGCRVRGAKPWQMFEFFVAQVVFVRSQKEGCYHQPSLFKHWSWREREKKELGRL